MFSGIISTVAKVKKSQKVGSSLVLTIEKPRSWRLKPGDSVATDGACLTVSKVYDREYVTELMAETLRTTKFGQVVPTYVNLERPLTLSTVLDGHIVQGHIDTVARVRAIIKKGESSLCRLAFPKQFSTYVVERGSITIDGIALTVVKEGPGWCAVSLVDYTLKHTTIGEKKVGDLVNVEFDIIAKYVSKLVNPLTR